MVVLAAAVVLVWLVVVVWRRWVRARWVRVGGLVGGLVGGVVVVGAVGVVVSLVVAVWRRWVLVVLGIVVRRRGRCGVVRMMWCVWMPWRSVVLR